MSGGHGGGTCHR